MERRDTSLYGTLVTFLGYELDSNLFVYMSRSMGWRDKSVSESGTLRILRVLV